jgi:hypothetical protein
MTIEPWPFVPSDKHGWPPLSGDAEAEKLLFTAQLEVRKKRTDQEIARAAAENAADLALEKAFYDGIVDVAKGSIDRARASADFVQKAAAAIGTIYAAALGVSFSVAERPFPARGVLPAIFLGVSIVCATYFLAWLHRYEGDETEETRDDSPPATPLLDRLTRLYIRWNRHIALERRKWLRASVVALGASIVLLPAAFIPLGKRPAAPSIQWPQPAQAAPAANIELRKILYQGEVSEATKVTKAPVTGRSTGPGGCSPQASAYSSLSLLSTRERRKLPEIPPRARVLRLANNGRAGAAETDSSQDLLAVCGTTVLSSMRQRQGMTFGV